MMIKWIGCLLLTLAVIVWGGEEAVKLKKKTRRVNDYLELVRYIRTQIDCFSRPIGDILATYPGPVCFASVEFCGDPGATLKTIISTDVYLSDEVKTTLSAFAENIGGGTKEESVRLCDFTATELERLSKKYSEEYPEKARLWRTLPCLALLSLLILLL